MLDMQGIKKNILIKRNLRWDVTPEVLFKPRFTMGREREAFGETEGYMFYIEKTNSTPKLMLIRTIKLMSTTVDEVGGVPEDLLKKSLESGKPVAGMYPISKDLEEWLKEELGLTARP